MMEPQESPDRDRSAEVERLQPAAVEGAEVNELRQPTIESTSQHEVTWVSELFADESGSHLIECRQAGAGPDEWEAFFLHESLDGLKTIDRLRAELIDERVSARVLAERAASGLRLLSERAVTFGHAQLGVTLRRACAAVHAAAEAPEVELQTFAVRLGVAVPELRAYLTYGSAAQRAAALARAEEALGLRKEPPDVRNVESLTFSLADALRRARQLCTEAKAGLEAADPEVGRCRQLVAEALDLIEHALGRADSGR